MSINLPILTKFDSSGIAAAESSLGKFGKVVGGIAAAAAAVTAGIAAKGLKDFADFDAKLQESVAIMGDVSSVMRDDMAEAAKLVGLNTKFSAEEAAESFYFLASAGLTASESIAALPQVAAFAQAGMFDMATATDIVTDAQSALGLSSDDAAENFENLTRVTDVFVKAATLGNTSVEQLGAAMTSKAATALTVLGKSVEEGAAALTVFADQGIKGERAGTLLTNTLNGLVKQSQKTPGAFEELGVSVFDADGDMRNMADVVGDLETGLDGMSVEAQSAALSQLGFGEQTKEGISALLGNSEALREYEEELKNAGGTAEEVAAKQMDSLTGDMILLNSAFANASLVIGEAFEPAARGLVGALTPIVKELTPVLAEILDDLAPKIERVAEKLGDFIVKISSEQGRNQIFRDVSKQIDDFFTGGGLQKAIVGMNQFRNDLIMKILDALPGIIEGFTKMLPGIIAFITGTMIPMLLASFAMILKELISVLGEVLPMLVESLAEMVPIIIQSLADLIPVIIETLLGFIPVILETALTFFSALIEAFSETIPLLIGTLVELIPTVIASIVEMLPQLVEGALALFFGLIDALVETIPILLQALIEAFPDVLAAVVDLLPDLIDSAMELFMGIVQGLIEILPDLIAAVIALMPEITVALLQMLPELILAALDLFLGIVMGISEALPEIIIAVVAMIPEITDALIDSIPLMIDAGLELLMGLATGIYENLPRIAGEIAESIGNTITNSVKGFFGIESPSKLFAGIGGDLAAGLEQGIQDSKDLAVGASLEMASEVKFASDSAFDGVSAGAMFTPSFGNTSKKQKSAGSNINITINAGIGSDPVSIGRGVVDAIKRYESVSGKVFVSA